MSSDSAIFFSPPTSPVVDVLIIAGEHSGDQHAARMVRRFLQIQPQASIVALGGPELKRAGAQLLYDLTASSVVGMVEAVKHYSFFKNILEATLSWIREYKPRAVCFVDYPGINLRLAEALFEQGLSRKAGGEIRTLFYISPQIWVWKAGRRFKMAKCLDALAVIFPFEIASYADTNLPVEFVGHPFVEEGHVSPVAYDANGAVLLLPGSRKQAVGRIFPLMLAGFRAFGERSATVLFPSKEIAATLRAANPPANVELRSIEPPTGAAANLDGSNRAERTPPILACAVLTSSGTMSMQCALAGIPGAVVYRAHPLTYLLGRLLVKVPFLGIANLLLGKAMYPEYLQGAARPQALAQELKDCIQNPDRRRSALRDAEKLKEILHQPTSGTAGDWLARRLS